MVCMISTKYSAEWAATPYKMSMVFTVKCQGPAPLGVGTRTAMLPTTNVTRPQERPKDEVKSKQKKVR